jgi:hypothetical protein
MHLFSTRLQDPDEQSPAYEQILRAALTVCPMQMLPTHVPEVQPKSLVQALPGPKMSRQTRLALGVGGMCSYSADVQTVSVEQTRLLVAVRGLDSYSLLVSQIVNVEQIRLLVVVGAVDWYSLLVSQTVNVEQIRLLSVVGAVDSYSVDTLQMVVGVQTRLLVAVAAVVW